MLTQKDFIKIENYGNIRLSMTISINHPGCKEENLSMGKTIEVDGRVYSFGYPRVWEKETLTVSAYLAKVRM